MTGISTLVAKAIAAAATITGKKFALMVASSLVATTGIVAAGLTSTSNDLGPLAGLLGRSLAASEAPVSTEPEAEPETAPEPGGGSSQPALASGGGEVTSSGSLPAPAPTTTETPSEETEKEPASEAEPGLIQHVFVVSLASPGYEASFGTTTQMPYLATTLRPKGSLLSNYTLLDGAAAANSIAAVGGQRPNALTKADCPTYSDFPPTSSSNSAGFVSGEGCIYPVETLSFADQIVGAQLKWHAYMEGMVDEAGAPASCVHPEPGVAEAPLPGGYSSRLNPFAYFHSLLDLGDCATNDVPLTELDRDLRKVETTPNYSYISPTPCNAGVVGQCPPGAPQGAAAADAFLATLVPKILKSAAYKKDGLLIVTFNQVSPTDPSAPATPSNPDPLKVGALLLSRYASPGGTDAVAYGPYSMLRSVEDIFQLDYLAGAGGTKVRSFAPALLGQNGGD